MSPESPTNAWHVAERTLDHYLSGQISETDAASVETHLIACATCRDALAQRSAPVAVSASWAGVERRIDNAVTSPVEQIAMRLGLSDRDARTLAPTLSLRVGWLAATAVALVGAALLARQPNVPPQSLARLCFFTLAPLLPLASVVTALGAGAEPIPELANTTPASRLRIVAVRATTVLLTSIGLGLVVSTLLPGSWARDLLWLGPSLALSALGTVVSGRSSAPAAIASLGGAWIAFVVLFGSVLDDRYAAFLPTPQAVYLVIAVATVATVAMRPRLLELGRLS